jgi:hypothetical protein
MSDHNIDTHEPEYFHVHLANGIGAGLLWGDGPHKSVVLRFTPAHLESLETVVDHLRAIAALETL